MAIRTRDIAGVVGASDAFTTFRAANDALDQVARFQKDLLTSSWLTRTAQTSATRHLSADLGRAYLQESLFANTTVSSGIDSALAHAQFGLSDVLSTAMHQFIDQQDRLREMVVRPLWDVPSFDLFPEIKRSMRQWAEIAESLRSIDPPNWPEDAKTADMHVLIQETGWALTYVPRAEIVSALLAADPANRETVLLDHTTEVLDDCRTCLDEVDVPEAEYLVTAVAQAIDALAARLPIPAQTAVASVLTDILQRVMKLSSFGQAAREFDVDLDEMPVHSYRFWLIASTIPKALDRYRPHAGDPVPGRFNRHAVAHTVDPAQLNDVNALVGLMLVTGLIREIAHELAEGTGAGVTEVA